MSIIYDEEKQRNVDLDFEELTSEQEDLILAREGE